MADHTSCWNGNGDQPREPSHCAATWDGGSVRAMDVAALCRGPAPAGLSSASMGSLPRWLPFLRWPRPDLALLRGETLAALTVAVVMIPQSVAYAQLAGMPLVTGL